jgi:hypothetical protein
LKSRGDVDAIAVHGSIGLPEDLSEVDTDAEQHLAILGDRRGARSDVSLRLDRGFDRTRGGIEDRQDGVTSHVYHASATRLDCLAEDRSSAIEGGDRGPFIDAHEARVASYVS